MEVKKVYKESIPHLKLIGKRLTSNDQDEAGTFAHWWQQSFQEGWFDTLSRCKGLPGVGDDFLGAMRMTGERSDCFEYWIGMFRAPDAETPAGFESVEISAGEIGVCWLYGSDKNGELYSMEASDLIMATLKEQNWHYAETGWFFERYNCPRFTVPDEGGNVILDICAYLI